MALVYGPDLNIVQLTGLEGKHFAVLLALTSLFHWLVGDKRVLSHLLSLMGFLFSFSFIKLKGSAVNDTELSLRET